jgi:predicted  nucleic acid-binding Zn-ribbon protein
MRFRNFYRCERCGHTWTDVWSATCDDDCPHCGARHMSPYQSEDVQDAPRWLIRCRHLPPMGALMSKSADTSTRIRQLNDAFRQTFIGGRVMLTAGVDALPDADKAALLDRVRTFERFNGDNDPYGEHDFVDIEHDGEKYFAKLDYYAADMHGGSEDPSDPSKTVRVLTVMRADEY